jgi:hypothetical protein
MDQKRNFDANMPEDYNTAINIIGGLKDFSVIFKAIDSYFSQNVTLDELVKQRNEFSLRTEKSRTRIERAVRQEFLTFENEDHQNLIRELFTERVPLNDKELALFWQFALNNILFRDITSQVFMKTYYSGRVGITSNDVIAYLKEVVRQNKALDIKWSENTIKTLASKYLNLMTKLSFLSAGRVKSFRHIRPSSEAQVLFLYFAKLSNPGVNNILTNKLLPLGFIPSEDIHDKLKRLSLKGFFDMSFTGIELNINLTHSYKGICNVLYN